MTKDETKTALVKRKEFYNKLSPKISTFLKKEELSKLSEIVYLALANDTSLQNCDPLSFQKAVIDCARYRVMPDGRQSFFNTYMVRDKSTGGKVPVVEFQLMAAGKRELVMRSREVLNFTQQVVYKKDKFEYFIENGNTQVKHSPCLDEDRGALRLVYSIAKLKNGETSLHILTKADVERKRAYSNSWKYISHFENMKEEDRKKHKDNWKYENSTWVKSTQEMWEKTALISHSKSLPMSYEDRRLLLEEEGKDVNLLPNPQDEAPLEIAEDNTKPVALEQSLGLNNGVEKHKKTTKETAIPNTTKYTEKNPF